MEGENGQALRGHSSHATALRGEEEAVLLQGQILLVRVLVPLYAAPNRDADLFLCGRREGCLLRRAFRGPPGDPEPAERRRENKGRPPPAIQEGARESEEEDG